MLQIENTTKYNKRQHHRRQYFENGGDILKRAAYLFDKKPDSDNRH